MPSPRSMSVNRTSHVGAGQQIAQRVAGVGRRLTSKPLSVSASVISSPSSGSSSTNRMVFVFRFHGTSSPPRGKEPAARSVPQLAENCRDIRVIKALAGTSVAALWDCHNANAATAGSRRASPRCRMASRENALLDLTPEVLLKAYACGIFPMAESAEDPALYWIEPEKRGIIPLDAFHVPARLARTVRSTPLHRRLRPRLRRRDRRLRGAAARSARAPGSTRASASSMAGCSTSAIATPSRSMTATRWSAGSTA